MEFALLQEMARGQGIDLIQLAILDSIKDPVQVVDRDYRIVWCNSFCSSTGCWPHEHLIGRICYELFFGRKTPCPDCPLEDTFALGQSQVKEKVFPLPGGSTKWRQVHSYPLLDAEGRVAYVVKIGFDITERKLQQTRQEKYVEYLENSVQSSAEDQRAREDADRLARQRYDLTRRELEVLRLLAQGFTNANIANILSISPNTVKTHVVHVFDKLGVGDRAQAAVLAARMKLV